MGLLDDITTSHIDLITAGTDYAEAQTGPPANLPMDPGDLFEELLQAADADNPDDRQIMEVLANRQERLSPGDEAAGAFVDAIEETMLASINNEGQLTPDNVESPLDDAEGTAASVAVGFALLTTLIEAIPLEDMDAGMGQMYDALAFMFVEDIVGRELEAELQEGVDPALKQLVHRRRRSKQADFADFTEANLRSKSFGGGVDPLTGDVPEEMQDLFHPDDFGWLADPDTYGTIPDQTPVYELDALDHLEPEELFEEGPQKGVVPSRAATEQILKISGLPEDVQSVFLTLWENIPRSADMLQESIAFEEPMRVIDEAIFEDRMTVDHGLALAEQALSGYVQVSDAGGTPEADPRPQEEVVDIILGELQTRWEILASIPGDVPTRGMIERWYRNGVITASQFQHLNDRFGIQSGFFAELVIDDTIRQGASDIAEQFILGRLSGTEARFRLGLIGFNSDEGARILAGADPDTVIQDRFEAQLDPSQLPVSLAVGIGDARAASLRAVGIDSLSALSEAAVEDLTAVTNMTDTQAEQAIQSAQLILEEAPQGG